MSALALDGADRARDPSGSSTGLEVTIVGTISSRLTEDGSGIKITEGQIGQAAALYVAGACALFFGWLADRLGRKKLFLITLAVYLVATVATAFSGSFLFSAVCRFSTAPATGTTTGWTISPAAALSC